MLLNRGQSSSRGTESEPTRALVFWGTSQTLRSWVGWLGWALFGAGLWGCAGTPLPCRSPEHCSAQTECLAHRCVALGADPVAVGATRLVLPAAEVAVVRSRGAGAGLPPTVTLGGPEPTAELLLVRFPRSWATFAIGRAEIDAAFLVLAPAASADPTGADVQLQVALAGAPWAPGTLDQAPPARSPNSTGLARTRPPRLLRIDVTAQLKALQGPSARDHGLLVRGETAAAPAPAGAPAALPNHGATYLTGADGELPRLDVYFRLH